MARYQKQRSERKQQMSITIKKTTMTEYETITLSLIVKPRGEPIFSERATIIEMVDEAAGPFITIRQINESPQLGEVTIEGTEWPQLKEAIEHMLAICETQDESINPKQ